MNKKLIAAAGLCAVLGSAVAFAQEGGETCLVYPSSATAKLPIRIGIGREKTVKPPVKESGDREIDTPIGQVGAILETLEYLQKTQESNAEALEALLERAPEDQNERFDEILAAIEKTAAETQNCLNALKDAGQASTTPVSEPSKSAPPEPLPAPTPIPAPAPSAEIAADKTNYWPWIGPMLFILAWFIGTRVYRKASSCWSQLTALNEKLNRPENRE